MIAGKPLEPENHLFEKEKHLNHPLPFLGSSLRGVSHSIHELMIYWPTLTIKINHPCRCTYITYMDGMALSGCILSSWSMPTELGPLPSKSPGNAWTFWTPLSKISPTYPWKNTPDVSPTVYEGILSFWGFGEVWGIFPGALWAKSLTLRWFGPFFQQKQTWMKRSLAGGTMKMVGGTFFVVNIH